MSSDAAAGIGHNSHRSDPLHGHSRNPLSDNTTTKPGTAGSWTANKSSLDHLLTHIHTIVVTGFSGS